ncbi:MAG: hypothetical protein KJO81_08240 [Gammaproteobacteria bacterium]|nr:hypothetical protein [Gammaproteobacteria bacterium]
MLHELLKQIEREKQKVKEDVATNIEEVLLPVIRQLKQDMNDINRDRLTLSMGQHSGQIWPICIKGT